MFTPSFPPYTGPHPVGSIDLEFPISSLTSSAKSPPPFAEDEKVETVQYRVFYPCVLESPNRSKKEEKVYWIPDPQRGYIESLVAFTGLGRWGAGILSYLPRVLYNIQLPIHPSAPLLPRPSSTRFPVLVFSHGLWGTRNTYSYLLASLASHGIVTIVPEHRDGSSCASFIRNIPPPSPTPAPSPSSTSPDPLVETTKPNHTWTSHLPFASGPKQQKYSRTVAYNAYPHTHTPEVEEGRNAMLRIRCWELDLIYSSLISLSHGHKLPNLAQKSDDEVLTHKFKDQLDLHPGNVVWAGHSFGAAAVMQFVKSVFHHTHHIKEMGEAQQKGYEPLFVHVPNTPIAAQITRESRLILFDAWVFTLSFKSTRWLNEQPLPCFAGGPAGGGPGGAHTLALESGEFFRWKKHLVQKKMILSPDPLNPDRDENGDRGDEKKEEWTKPHWWVTPNSAHLSQSDWALLFPWLCRKAFGATEAERTLRFNIGAVVEFLKSHATGAVVDGDVSMSPAGGGGAGVGSRGLELANKTVNEEGEGGEREGNLLDRKNTRIQGWEWIDSGLTPSEIEEWTKAQRA